MESKGKDVKGIISGAKGEEEQQAPQKNIVIRFTEFATKVLNQDMDDFFEDNMKVFEQDDEELMTGAGETLEQYEVYQKYLAQLEKHFDGFAAEEGYDSVLDCFNALNNEVIEDKREREKAMKEMAQRLKEMQERWQQQMIESANGGSDSKAEGKNDENCKGLAIHHRESKSGDEDDDAKADSKQNDDDIILEESGPPPAVIFFQPVSMDSLLSHVLSMTEYTTFSFVMRTKVRQAKLLRMMERHVENHKEDSDAREILLENNSRMGIEQVYEQLVDRVCGLTPHQETIQAEVRTQLCVGDWSDMLAAAEDGPFSARYKQVFKRLVMSVCMAMWSMVSLNAQQQVRLELCRFIPMIDQLDSKEDVFAAAVGFLRIGHTLVDETEINMLKVLQAHSHHHRRRRMKETDNMDDVK